jgi:hypothetical protein
MAGEKPIDTIINENNNNGGPIKPGITWYAITSQLRRSIKYNSAISPSIPSISSLEKNKNPRRVLSINICINGILFLISAKIKPKIINHVFCCTTLVVLKKFGKWVFVKKDPSHDVNNAIFTSGRKLLKGFHNLAW